MPQGLVRCSKRFGHLSLQKPKKEVHKLLLMDASGAETENCFQFRISHLLYC